MKKRNFYKFFMIALMMIFSVPVIAQKPLNRGLMAVSLSGANMGTGNLVSWRVRSTDDIGIKFKLYKGTSAATQNTPLNNGNFIESKTNFRDETGTVDTYYKVEAYDRSGKLLETMGGVKAWGNQTLSIPLGTGPTDPDHGATYTPNDASFCDMDGDGEYEIILKWSPSNEMDAASNGTTSSPYFDCIKMNGTRLWRIRLGDNFFTSAHTIQFIAWDLDGDGYGEFMCKTAPGTIDGQNKPVLLGSDRVDAKLLGSNGKQTSGSEYITVFNGRTGANMKTIYYHTKYSDQSTDFWGDTWQNRSERYLAALAYLDGPTKRPSAIFSRGYYSGAVVGAYDWDGTNLTLRWKHVSATSGQGLWGEGAHWICVGDCDSDSKQEIIYGSSALKSDGTLLYRTGLGHGDAVHLGDMIPSNPGLEVLMCHEHGPDYGIDIRDARTGRILQRQTEGGDTGRGLAAHFDSSRDDWQFMSSARAQMFNCADQSVNAASWALGSSGAGINARIYWNGDLYDDYFDKSILASWNPTYHSFDRMKFNGGNYMWGNLNNYTKMNPCVIGDLLGDWREEMVTWDGNNTAGFNLLVNATSYESDYRLPHLMDDPQYRVQVVAQNVCYNQPPHLSYDPARTYPNGYYDAEGIGGTYYIYNELQDKFLSRKGADACVDDFGIPMTLQSAGATYLIKQEDLDLYYSGMYWTAANAAQTDATHYKLTPVAGQPNTYTFKNMTNPADDADMYINTVAATMYRVANNSSKTNTPDLRNSYWKLMTTAERDAIIARRALNGAKQAAQLAGATSITSLDDLREMPVEENCTNAIPDRTFGLKAQYGVYEVYQGDNNDFAKQVDLTQTATGLAKGLYRVSIPAFYRQGTSDICKRLADYNMSCAYIQAGDNVQQLKPWVTDYTADNTTQNNPNSRQEANAKYSAGKYQNEVYAYVPNDNGTLTIKLECPVALAKGWFAFGAIKLERLQAVEVVDPLGISGQTYYIYNELQDKFLSRKGNDAFVDNFGIGMKFTADGSKYTVQQIDNGKYYSGMYWTAANANEGDATRYKLTAVAGQPDTYTFTNMTNPADDANMYINMADMNHVANNSSAVNTPDLRNSYWKLVTAEEREEIIARRVAEAALQAAHDAQLSASEYDALSKVAVAEDCTSAIADKTFGLTPVNNVYEIYQGTANLTQTATGLQQGLYRVSIPALYRQGTNANCTAMADQNTSVAYLQIGDNQIQIKDWASGQTNGNNPNTRAEADAKFKDGNYENEMYVYVPNDNGSISITIGCPINIDYGWLAFGDIKLERLVTPPTSGPGLELKTLIDAAQAVADEYSDKVGIKTFEYPLGIYNDLLDEIAAATAQYESGTVTNADLENYRTRLENAVQAMQNAERNPLDPYKSYTMMLANDNGTPTNFYLDMTTAGAFNTKITTTATQVKFIKNGETYSIYNPANETWIAAEKSSSDNSRWGSVPTADATNKNSQYFNVTLQDDGTVTFASLFNGYNWLLGALTVANGGEVTCYKYRSYPVATKWIITELPSLRGDVDVDHDVDLDDVTLLKKILLGQEPDRSPADVNENGRTGISDMSDLINILKNKQK